MTATRLALAVRVLIAVCTRTFFQPDEYFQSLEPAYHAVFGYGDLTWEWLTPKPIRSIFYPALNIPIYWALKVTNIARYPVIGEWLLMYTPRVVHGSLAAATDIWLCKMAQRWLGKQYVSTALFLSLTSFFHALSLSRSLSNSLETSLSTIAYAYYPWDVSSHLSPQLMYHRSRITTVLMFSALACMVRPSNAIIWVFLFGRLLWALRSSPSAAKALLLQVVTIGVVASVSLVIIDTVYYGRLTFTPLNFLLTNLSSVSLFYGINKWHYYVTQALPILCTTSLPFVLCGIWQAIFDKHATALRNMLATVIWTVGILSFSGHKEWRFIHPILPLLHILSTKSLVDLSSHARHTKRKTTSKKKKIPSAWMLSDKFRPNLPIRTHYFWLLLLTIPASVYVVFFYRSAPITLLTFIRSLPSEELGRGGIGFLMPCHSTPGHSYIHRESLAHGRMWSLGCEPPLQQQQLSTYRDQSDVFFSSPISYLESRFPPRVNPSFPLSRFPSSIPGKPNFDEDPWSHEWPLYLAFFGSLLEDKGVRSFLQAKGYVEIWKRGRVWEGEGHRKGGVKLWKWKG